MSDQVGEPPYPPGPGYPSPGDPGPVPPQPSYGQPPYPGPPAYPPQAPPTQPMYPPPPPPPGYAHPGQPGPQPSAYPQPGYPGAPPAYPGAPPAYPPGSYPPGAWPAPGARPARPRPWLIVLIIVAAVLVLAGGVLAATVYFLNSSSDSPRVALDNWFEAVRDLDTDAVRSLTCAQYVTEVTEDLDAPVGAVLTWEIHEVDQVDDTLAEAAVTIRAEFEGEADTFTERLAIVREDGAWKVCGPAADLERPGGS